MASSELMISGLGVAIGTSSRAFWSLAIIDRPGGSFGLGGSVHEIEPIVGAATWLCWN